MSTNKSRRSKFPNVHTVENGFFNVIECGFVQFIRVEDLSLVHKKIVKKVEKNLRSASILLDGESIFGVYEEKSMADDVLQILQNLHVNEIDDNAIDAVIEVHRQALYNEIFKAMKVFGEYGSYGLKPKAIVYTKYKTVAKKMKPIAIQLSSDTDEHIKQAKKESSLRRSKKIGHKFTEKTLASTKIAGYGFLTKLKKKKFQEMLSKHGKAFASSPDEIECVHPSEVAPMVIFTIPHVPLDLKPIPVPRALLPKLVDLLKEKVCMDILEPSMAPYSNQWFTMPKKFGALRFIQDMQLANKETIRNKGFGPILDEVAETFTGHAIYSIEDLYSDYDQFQLAFESRNLTTIKTPLGLVQMYTLL